MTVQEFIKDIEAKGFVFRGVCQCNGFHTNKYKKDEFLIYIRTRKGKVSLKKYGVTVIGYTALEDFITEFENHVNNVSKIS